MFVRFGGCDYRCSWCDSMYAVDPVQVREAARMTQDEIVKAVLARTPSAGYWVTLSGGNPALMRFESPTIVDDLRARRMKVTVETQGTLWQPWLETVDHLTVSPKPPSSGMGGDENQRLMFMLRADKLPSVRRSLKMVVFDQADLDFARTIVKRWPDWTTYISAGTPQQEGGAVDLAFGSWDNEVRHWIAERYRWLCEEVAGDRAFVHTRVLPQLHVIAFGNRRGV